MVTDGDVSAAYHASLCSTQPYKKEIVLNSHDFSSLIVALFSKFAEIKGRQMWVEKSAFFYPEPLDYLEAVFPNARVIHIVRDGRDCVLSWQKHWFGPKSLEDGAKLWKQHVHSKRAWTSRTRLKTLQIKYEDLISDLDTSLDVLQSFLNLKVRKPSKKATNDYAKVVSNWPSQKLVFGEVLKTNKNKFLLELSQKSIDNFQSLAGSELNQLGYELHETPKISSNNQSKIKIVYRHMFMSFVYRFLKSHLPIVIWILNCAGLNAAKIANVSPRNRAWLKVNQTF